jgi:hypothetical protein
MRLAPVALVLLTACKGATQPRPAPVPEAPAAAVPPSREQYVSDIVLPSGPFRDYHPGQTSCGLRPGGQLACFRPDGGGVPFHVPTGTFTRLSWSYRSGCALREDGTAACFGEALLSGPFASLPPGTYRDVVTTGHVACGITTAGRPVCAGSPDFELVGARPPDGEFTTIACTSQRCCALREDGTLACFGEAGPPPPAGEFTAVGLGGTLGCALDRAGEARCWGHPDELPGRIPAGPFVQLSVDMWMVCGVRKDESAVCFGRHAHTPMEWPAPVLSVRAGCAVTGDQELFCKSGDFFGPVPRGRFVEVAGGNDVMCAIDTAGRLTCWGERHQIVEHVPDETFQAISLATLHACGLTTAGQLRCWGSDHTKPPPPGRFATVTAGTASCALDADRKASCWGERVPAPPAGPVRAIASGMATTCWLDEAGALACARTWGYVDDHVETDPPPLGQAFTQVVLGYEHGCALAQDGRASCWGRDTAGETRAPEGRFVQLTLGEKRSCGLRDDGTVACWGGRPRPAPADLRFSRIAMTTDEDLLTATYVCGIVTGDQRLVCWSYGTGA